MSDEEWTARVDADGRVVYLDVDESERTWSTVTDLAREWWADSVPRTGGRGGWRTAAHPAVNELLEQGDPAILTVIDALIDAATSDEELTYVGASALEDLLSHYGHSAAFVNDVERRARQQPRFKLALSGVWLSRGVSEDIRHRLGALGATVLAR
jgi:hypothetical protein